MRTMRVLVMTMGALRAPGALFRALLMIGLVLTLPVVAAAQSRVFYDGGEGPAAPWGVNKCTLVAVGADGGAPFAGTRMWRCAWNGTLDWQHPDKLRDMAFSFAYNREFVVRFKRRYDANVDWAPGSKEWRVSFESSGEVYGACQREKGAGGADMFLSGNSVSSHWGGGPLCGQGWQEIAIYRRDAVNGAGGITRVWQDGRLIREWTGNTGGHGGNANLPSNWSSNPGWAHDALNYIYFDEIEAIVDTSGGEPVTGRLEDNTARVSGVPPPPPPPAPVPCEGTWVETLSAPTPLVCDATRVQTRTLTRTWVTSREPANGGAACPANPPPSTVTEACDYVPPPPPPPPPVPTLVGRFASQATYSTGGVSGLRVTLRVSAAQPLPAIDSAVTLRVPLANGASELRSGRVRSTRANAYSGGDGQIVVELPGLNAIGLELQLPQ